MNSGRASVFRDAALLLAGFVLLSPMSFAICSRIGLPHLPELLAVPFLWVFRRDIVPAFRQAASFRRLPAFLWAVVAWLLLLTAGLVHSTHARGTISCARSYFLILAIAFLSRWLPPVTGRSLLLCSIGSTAGSIVDALLVPAGNISNDFHLGTIASVFHVAYLAFGSGNIILVGAAVPLLVWRVILSSFRQVALAAVAGASLAMLVRLLQVRSIRGAARILVAVVGLGLTAYSVSWYMDAVGLTPTQQNRLITRFASLGDEGDSVRIARVRAIPDELLSRIVPEGFPAKGYADQGDTGGIERHGLLMDLPIYELIVIFGGPLGILIYLFVGWRGVSASMRAARAELAPGDESLCVSFFLYLALSWLTGAFLWHSYEAALFGLSLGRWWAVSAPVPAFSGARIQY